VSDQHTSSSRWPIWEPRVETRRATPEDQKRFPNAHYIHTVYQHPMNEAAKRIAEVERIDPSYYDNHIARLREVHKAKETNQ
jgi:hypothetical protein